MAVLNIEKSFLTENRSVVDFLNQSGQGLYIPLYQREYSWDSDNIEQLLEDLARGIQRIALGEVSDDNKEIRFLGTIITVVEPNRNNIYPVDIQAVPSRIEKLIDGQQRVSTIALMATLLTKRLTEIKNKVKSSNPIYEQVKEICDTWIDQKLATIFSFDLGRGKPRLKPKVIRGAKDYWTRDKEVDVAYQAELSNYLGHFIQAYTDKTTFPCLSKEKYGDTLLYKNGRRIEVWLKKTVATAHEEQNDEFVTAVNILENFSQDQLWDFERPDLVDIVNEKNTTDKKSNSYILSELVQTLAVCHYLLDRCCFTIIQPTDDDWAFDMFQSLNATGTPLTAIETFKPTVVNTTDNEEGYQFKDSESEKYFKKVEDFLSKAKNAQQKNKLTNDFLTSFFISVDGRTMSTHFSYQRKALDSAYSDRPNYAEKETFIKEFGNYAEFYSLWMGYTGENNQVFPGLEGHQDADYASMMILMMKESNHKMAITVLGKMYEPVIKGELHAPERFIQTAKLIGSYFFLWRSAYSNSGLDSSYREFFKRLKVEDKKINLSEVKRFVKDSLAKKGVVSLETWKHQAQSYLKYKNANNSIIRMALLAAAHDAEAANGSIKEGREGISQYLTLEKWRSDDLKTIEHVAPQNNSENAWDAALYDDSETYQTIGNLTLLPRELNSSAGNKEWEEKLLYYLSVSETSAQMIEDIKKRAENNGITLNDGTLALLKECKYNKHLESISKLPEGMSWDAELVNRRSSDILDIVWKRLSCIETETEG